MLTDFDVGTVSTLPNGQTLREYQIVASEKNIYAKHPIPIDVGELVRIYLVNITEFDPVNSFHLHAGMFQVYRTGTRLEPHEYTDMIAMAQGERHILELTLEYPGQYMFHAHQSEFSELGWLGIFDARPAGAAASFEEAGVAGICDLAALTGGRI